MIPWWFGDLLGETGARWSDEEVRIHTAIWAIAFVAFLLLFFGGVFLGRRFGMQTGVGTLVLVISVPIAVYVGRRLSTLLWPNLAKVADKNAAQRLAKRGRDRQS